MMSMKLRKINIYMELKRVELRESKINWENVCRFRKLKLIFDDSKIDDDTDEQFFLVHQEEI